MIIGNVIPDRTAQMNVIEEDQVIKKLSATTSDPAFRYSILQGHARLMRLGFMPPALSRSVTSTPNLLSRSNIM
ncbi:MAG: hypothetical protein H6Q06_1261 [Acidobacteria bacterium]|nr:hypothetical protein [Acidobacteriota bacterium]